VRKHRIQAVLSTLAQLRKATVSFVMSVCTSVRTSARLEQLGSHWTNFLELLYLCIFRQSVDEIVFKLDLFDRASSM
jgi:ribose 5-phosphate isomerase